MVKGLYVTGMFALNKIHFFKYIFFKVNVIRIAEDKTLYKKKKSGQLISLRIVLLDITDIGTGHVNAHLFFQNANLHITTWLRGKYWLPIYDRYLARYMDYVLNPAQSQKKSFHSFCFCTVALVDTETSTVNVLLMIFCLA